MTEVAKIDSKNMLNVIRRLSEILKEEVLLLKDMKLAQLHKSYNEKIALTSVLETYKEILVENPDLLKSLPKETVEEMRKENNKFETLVAEGEKQVLRARKVHGVIMDAIKSVVSRRVAESTGYNKEGLIDDRKKKVLYTPPVSVSENC